MAEVTETTEVAFPFPIAASHRRMRLIDEQLAEQKHASYGDLFEVFTKFLAIIAIQDLRTHGTVPTYLDEFLTSMVHPQLGQWNQIIRSVSSEDTGSCPVAQRVSGLYKSKPGPVAKEAARTLASLLNSGTSIRTYRDVFELLGTYRNKAWKGHGARLTSAEYKERIPLLRTVIEDLLSAAAFLSTCHLVYVDEVQLLPTDEFRHKLKSCTGTQIEHFTLTQPSSLRPQALYLQAESTKGPVYLVLHPLLTLYPCRECRSEQVFVFNDYKNSKLEFLSYGCGHFHWPDMLPDEFERYFHVTLSDVSSGVDRGDMSSAEAKEKSEALFSTAMARISSGHYFEALEYLQISLACDSTSDGNYYAALMAMMGMKSPSEVMYYLTAALQLDGSNAAAQGLSEKLLVVFPDDERVKGATDREKQVVRSIARQLLEVSTLAPEIRPIHYYFTPKPLRSFSYVFWILVAGAAFLLRHYVGAAFGIPADPRVQVLKFSLVVAFLVQIHVLTGSMRWIYFALLQQVSGTMREQFAAWYQENTAKTFGTFLESGPLVGRLRLAQPSNRSYLAIVAVLFPVAVAGSVWLTCYGSTDIRHVLAITFDYTVMWAIVAPGGPVMLRSFLLLREYSKLPLRPAVSLVNKFTLNRVGRMLLLVSVPWTACYTLNTAIGYATFSTDLVFSQLALFYLMVVIGLAWTLLTPLFLSRALAHAKERVLAQYGEHIDVAFRRLIESPGQENAERYAWLSTHQAELLRIRTGALSIWTLLGVVAINVYVVALSIAYPFLKYGVSPNEMFPWFNRFWSL